MVTQSNPLKKLIEAEIQSFGPISVSSFMRLCLTHPEYGYYKTRDPLGKAGDFITAPEVSQMFGEMLGVWISITWSALGKPSKFVLGELGPGRGTLMSDAMRVLSKQPEILAACQIVLLETNEMLRQVQAEKLSAYAPEFIHEIDEFAALGAPVILLANEFFDALPIRQYQWHEQKWHERLVGLNGDDLCWGLSTTPIDAEALPATLSPQRNQEVFEDAPLAQSTMTNIAKLLNQVGGGMMAIDYGYVATQTGETLQAMANHKMVDPLADPGRADLTAHVNFEALVNAALAEGAHAHVAGTQKQLLEQLGIVDRAKSLRAANPERARSIDADLARLIGDDQMGDLFKAMVVFGQTQTKPPFVTSAVLDQDANIQHGFLGKQGGISPAPYESLNVSYSNKDTTDNVDENRAIIARAFDAPPEKFATVHQVHSNRVIVVDDDYDILSRPEADGLVTKRSDVLLGILTADCTPILFSDPVAKIIGACHAGWQGARDGIVANTVDAMVALGATPQNIIAAIGPNISYENYEVGPDFAKDFVARYADAAAHVRPPKAGAREHFDLTAFVRDRLTDSGVTNVDVIDACTYAEPDVYFSHRYATHQNIEMGRQLSVIRFR